MMTFKEQMELRRSLMDLTNTSMEIDLETSRHTSTISDWVEEQAKVTVLDNITHDSTLSLY